MARRIDRKPPAAEPASAAEDLQALQPDATLTIAGRAITIREYGLWEGLRVAALAKALIADMYDIAANGDLTYTAARHLFGKHQDVVIEISALAANVEPEWVATLKAADGELFLSTWLVVNGSFFGRELAVAAQVARVARATASRSTGSSFDSPTPGSAITTDSGDSPSAS
jgi:hypothetical protein